MVRASAASGNRSQRKALKGTTEALTRNMHMRSNTCCITWQRREQVAVKSSPPLPTQLC